MIRLRVGELAAVLGADVRPGTSAPVDLDRAATHVTADSRAVQPGSLFAALVGERVDGHAYVAQAFAQGAVAALVAHPVDDAPGPQLVVDDPLAALGRVARHVVDRAKPTGLRVVGLTGSQGKTSTKDLLGVVLAAAGPTIAPAGNLNNELGVPLTVARVERETRFLVAEMGARGIGHIAYLCTIAPPDVAVVLNVGHAHVGEFGGRDAIAKAKGELVEALDESGVAVLNRADPRVWAMRSRTRGRVLPFAVVEADGAAPEDPDAVWADGLAGDGRGRYSFTLHVRTDGAETTAAVALRGTGRHQVANATAAAAAATALGVELTTVAGALSTAEPASRWRMEVHDRADGVTVVNDSYNANPASMTAAVDSLVELARGRGPGRSRTWAVLGDMLELGSEAEDLHRALAAELAAAGVDEVVALGEFAPLLVEGQPGRARVAATGTEAAAWVRADVAPGDVVLVKASRGLALNVVADEILRAPEPERPADPEAGGQRVKVVFLAGFLALLGTLLGTRLAIRVLVKKGYGQLIRDDGPTSHHVKRGTPTMGGLVIIAAVLLAYTVSHLITWTLPSASGLLVLFLFAGLGLVGFLDDFIKISRQRSLGLRSKAKIAGQSLVAIVFALLSLQFPDERGITPASNAISFLRDIPWLALPVVLVVLWVILLIAAASNGVNLTDGLDGLASGACVMIFGAYTLINIWQYNQSCAYVSSAGPKCYEVRDPYDLAVVAVALAGACFGFLWWNAEPAKIFMGDTGSLSLGGALAGMAIFTRTELLLIILGGLLVIEVMSVVMQVSYFKLTHGKRIFKMSPIHHHFELLNWAQVTIVMRFWIICGLFVAAGLGIFYAEWVAGNA